VSPSSTKVTRPVHVWQMGADVPGTQGAVAAEALAATTRPVSAARRTRTVRSTDRKLER
jgi:hypothetical protein